jgi:hypothetical protein
MVDGKQDGTANLPLSFDPLPEPDAKEDVALNITAHHSQVTPQTSVSVLGWLATILAGLTLWYLIYLGVAG